MVYMNPCPKTGLKDMHCKHQQHQHQNKNQNQNLFDTAHIEKDIFTNKFHNSRVKHTYEGICLAFAFIMFAMGITTLLNGFDAGAHPTHSTH
ncbi:MAG TPA: hypothetical protein VJ201_08885, partial [Candidatus Babeliales bacterium]|nr:hypothetical protein [Candidatus Babeliales bacterium]